MTNDNYIAIGDIHGCFTLLEDLLAKIENSPYKDHRLVFLGDVIDRGPDSYDVVQKIWDLVKTKNAIALLGNHEDMMLEWVDYSPGDPTHYWMWNGAKKTINSYGSAAKIYGMGQFDHALKRVRHYDFIKSWPLYFETDKVWFSHAPIPHFKRGEGDNFLEIPVGDFRAQRQTLIWTYWGIDDRFSYDHGKLAVCGHVHAVREGIFTPRVYPKIIYADTGAGCWKEAPLTGVVITDGKMVDSIQAWPYKSNNTIIKDKP